jgi:linoleoyl-CoA desaturase
MIAFDFLLRDFMMIFVGKSDANHVYPKRSLSDQITFWAGKLFFVVIMFVLPLQVYPWWQVLIGFLLVFLNVGLVMGIVFQLAHINDITRYPEPVGKPPSIENEWAIHQVETTADFAPHNALLNFYIGGLNFQVEHHLLPYICHMNYPRLAPIVRATCEEFGVQYNCYPTWRQAMARHLLQLRRLGAVTQAVAAAAD